MAKKGLTIPSTRPSGSTPAGAAKIKKGLFPSGQKEA